MGLKFMKGNLKIFLEDKTIKYSTTLSLVVIIICSVLVVIFQPKLSLFVPFFNSFPWGVERLVTSRAVMLIPVFLIIVYFVNITLSMKLYKTHTLLARILSFNTLLIIVLGFMSYLQILFLVF